MRSVQNQATGKHRHFDPYRLWGIKFIRSGRWAVVAGVLVMCLLLFMEYAR